MLVMGLSGGPSLINENIMKFDINMFHDSAAVLIKNDEILMAIEEERLNRIKHTNKAPVKAIRKCLEKNSYNLQDVDQFAIYFDDKSFVKHYRDSSSKTYKDYTDYLIRYLYCEFGEIVDKKKFVFVPHHIAHAYSSINMSGFDEALVVVLDGAGDDYSGMVISYRADNIEILDKISIQNSLGLFYLEVTEILGYHIFDEYKVMGLAPYGNPEKYRKLFNKFYRLLPNGKFSILNLHKQVLGRIIDNIKDEERNIVIQNIAAALQESIEKISLHILNYYSLSTHHKNLCLAGGVAHNCKNNGNILNSNLFDQVFVQPASHDAGCALGAALYVSKKKVQKLDNVFWGLDIDYDSEIEKKLKKWSDFIEFKHLDNKYTDVACLLANGKIIGWVQGRSEFGPRALGHRSILADPRPSDNKDIINEMVKKRENYRPFAPAVIKERMSEFFECPKTQCDYSFMTYVVKVKDEMRKKLGAVTHVDGTARVQAVDFSNNNDFWKLLYEFNKITNIPILLNTSFNNFAEPIVDSVEDAITCYLTTKLDYLIIGEFFISRKDISDCDILKLYISIPQFVEIQQIGKYIKVDKFDKQYIVKVNYNKRYFQTICKSTYDLLSLFNGKRIKLVDLIHDVGIRDDDMDDIYKDIKILWERRMINLEP